MPVPQVKVWSCSWLLVHWAWSWVQSRWLPPLHPQAPAPTDGQHRCSVWTQSPPAVCGRGWIVDTGIHPAKGAEIYWARATTALARNSRAVAEQIHELRLHGYMVYGNRKRLHLHSIDHTPAGRQLLLGRSNTWQSRAVSVTFMNTVKELLFMWKIPLNTCLESGIGVHNASEKDVNVGEFLAKEKFQLWVKPCTINCSWITNKHFEPVLVCCGYFIIHFYIFI